MMKQKWYLLIICLVYCVTIWAQDDNPLWSIDNLSLSLQGDDSKIVNNNSFNIPDDWIGGDVVFVFELKKLRYAKESEDSIQPKEIWYKLNNGDAKNLEIKPTYKSKEGNDTTWSVSVSIGIKTDNLNANEDNVFSLSLSKDGDYKTVKETIHVWTLPGDPSFSPNSYKTFVGKKIIFTINDDVTKGLISEYIINGEEIAANKKDYEVTATDIGDADNKEETYTLTYKYKYGETIWKEDSISAKVTIYNLPVYTPVIIVNGEENDTHKSQNNIIDHIVMPSDNLTLKYEAKYGYDFSDNHTNKWNTDKSSDEISFEAKETNKVTVKVINKINDEISNEQTLTYNINVRQQPSVALHHIKAGNLSYLFNPSDGIEVSVDKKNDQDDLTWSYAWSVDNVPLENDNQKVIIPKEKLMLADNETEKERILQVNVVCKRGNFSKKYVDETLSHTIKVLSLPKATIGGDYEEEIITCDGQPANVTITPEGGYPNGYIFSIESIDGTNYGNSDESEGTVYNIHYTNKSDSVVNSTFRFAGENVIPIDLSTTGIEEKRFVDGVDSKTFKARIFPHPKVKFKKPLLDNYFYGSEITLSVDTVYDDMPSRWTFEWNLDGNVVESDKYNYSDTIPDGKDSLKEVHKLMVVAKNCYNEKVWAEDTLRHNYISWHRAQLDTIELKHENSNNENIYEGHEFELSSIQNYGYPKGWEYTWEREGSGETLSADSAHTFTAEFLGSEGSEGSESQTYILKVKNSIPGLDEDILFTDSTTKAIVVWRKAENYRKGEGESILTITDTENGAVIDNRIREGRVLKLKVPKAQYGYKNDWTYSWNVSSENSNEITFTPTLEYSGEAMTSESKTIYLDYFNLGPNEKRWEGDTITKPYTVYRKPRTPASLAQKGNGASRTLIATMAISDDQLKDNDYYLCFGHRETSGAVTLIGEPQLQEGPGQTRFSTQVSQDLWNDKSNLCVFALWHYTDGTWITSGLRFISDVKEDWDGSDYTGKNIYSGTTRGGDTTGIQETEITSQYIQATYNLSGTTRGTLQRGLNIVRMTDGTVRKVIKK